jgi:DNA polymerase-3 subunit epsilon
MILLRAVLETGIDIDQWLVRVTQPIGTNGHSSMKRDGDPNGDLAGEVLVFTGALSIPRREAADMAASVGCRVDDGVKKHTTILVVGDQDLRKLAGKEKSSKHLKAERLILQHQPIRIIGESDFTCLAEHLRSVN